MTPYHPWRELARLGVDVRYTDLGGLAGCWDPDTALIWLDNRLTQAERRSTLTHELIHAERGDEPCATEWHERHQERPVERAAALRLIAFDDLMDALAWCMSMEEVTEELHVDRAILDARLSMLDDEDQRIIRARFSEWTVC
jgi:Zn-dependent peptidase ImmA (M78 family)